MSISEWLVGGALLLAFVAWAWKRAAEVDREGAEQERRDAERERLVRRALDADLLRRIDSGEYRIPDQKVPQIMRQIFPESPRWAKREERAS